MDVVYANEECVAVVDPTDAQSVHEGDDSVGRQHSTDGM